MILSTRLRMFFTFFAMFFLVVAVAPSYSAQKGDPGGPDNVITTKDSDDNTRGFINFMVNKLDNSPGGYTGSDIGKKLSDKTSVGDSTRGYVTSDAPNYPTSSSSSSTPTYERPEIKKIIGAVRGFAFDEFIDSVESGEPFIQGIDCDGCGKKYNRNQKKSRGFASVGDQKIKVKYRKLTLKESSQKLIAGSSLFTDLAIISPALSSFGTQVDQARLQADVLALSSLAVQLSHIENVTGVKSEEMNSAILVGDASEILKDRKKGDFVANDYAATVNAYKIVFGLNSNELFADLTGKTEADSTVRGYSVTKGDYGGGGGGGGRSTRSTCGCQVGDPSCFARCYRRGYAMGNIKDSMNSTLNNDKISTAVRPRGFIAIGTEELTGTSKVGVLNKTESVLYVYIDGRYHGRLPAFLQNDYIVSSGETTVRLYNPSGKEVVETASLAVNEALIMSVSGGKASDKAYRKNKKSMTRGYTTTITITEDKKPRRSSNYGRYTPNRQIYLPPENNNFMLYGTTSY